MTYIKCPKLLQAIEVSSFSGLNFKTWQKIKA